MDTGAISSQATTYKGRPARLVKWTETVADITNDTLGSSRDFVFKETFPMNPMLIPAEMLLTLASQYQKFRFKQGRVGTYQGTRFRFVPTVPTTMPGQICLAHIVDPTQSIPEDFASLQRVTGAKLFNVWSEGECAVASDDESLLFMTDFENPRFSRQGYFMAGIQGVPLTGTPSVPAGSKIGTLKLDYEVLLVEPDPTPAVPFAGSISISAVAAGPLTWSTNLGGGWTRSSDVLTYHGPTKTFDLVIAVASDADEVVGPMVAMASTGTIVTNVTTSSKQGAFVNDNVFHSKAVMILKNGDTFTLSTATPVGNLTGYGYVGPSGPSGHS